MRMAYKNAFALERGPLQQPNGDTMRRQVDYFFATMSPWAYLGHQRFVDMARAAGAEVRCIRHAELQLDARIEAVAP